MNRHARQYLRRRDALREKLGGCCAICGWKLELEFDHPNGRSYEPRHLSSHRRIAQYERDEAAGNLRLLCKGCNRKDGGKRGGNGRPVRKEAVDGDQQL